MQSNSVEVGASIDSRDQGLALDLVEFFKGKSVAVTGAAGSVGSELVRQLLDLGVAEIRALDNDENGIFEVGGKFRQHPHVKYVYCDVSIPGRVARAVAGVDYLFHSAALKHVPICEEAPTAAVDVNVLGVVNVVEAALSTGIKRVVFTSSDKAVNPTNVMGASKLLGERIAVAANLRNGSTLISCTRFGNVAATRGSVLPLFYRQITQGGPLTLTAVDMTRFFMTLAESVSLIIRSMVCAHGGDTFVMKMKSLRIVDLAETLWTALGKPGKAPIEIIGPRMGEKMYEELTTDEEQGRTFEAGQYLIIQPPQLRHELDDTIEYKGVGVGRRTTRPYNSRTEPLLSHEEIASFLRDNNLVESLKQGASSR